MQEQPKKRFTVFIAVKDQEYLDVEPCDTMEEVNKTLGQARHTATGYAVVDRERGEIVKKKNLF